MSALDMHWRELADCARTENVALFLAKHPGSEAVAVCQGCPVRAECLHDALVSDARGGLWGGLAVSERRALPALPEERTKAISMLRQHLDAHHPPAPAPTAEAATAPAPKPKPPVKKTTPQAGPSAPQKPATEPQLVQEEPEPGATPRAALREAVAEMLRAGAPQKQIVKELGVSTGMIARTRTAYGIPYPKGPGFRFTPEQRAENERRALELLRAGATYAEVAEQVGISAPTITAIRKRAGLPSVQGRNGKDPRPRRSKAEALAECTEPYGDGHVRWTGPMAGRMPQLCAEGGKFNGRRVAFELHHGRPPAGYVRTSCTEPACIAGAHLIDDRTPRTPREEPVTVRALQNLQAETDQQGGPQAARDNRLTLTPPTEPETRPMPTTPATVPAVPFPARKLGLEELLAWGDSHPDPGVQDQAARARAAVEGLRARHAADQELTAITDEAAQLEKRLAELRAREAELAPAKKGKRKSGAPTRDYDTRTVRAWAAENNIDCPRVGQIPKRVLDAWRAANAPAGGDT